MPQELSQAGHRLLPVLLILLVLGLLLVRLTLSPQPPNKRVEDEGEKGCVS